MKIYLDSEFRLAEGLLADFEHPRGGVDERIELDIRRHRKGWGRFVVTDAGNRPVPGVRFRLVQKKHEFLFGCNLFKLGDFSTERENSAYETLFQKVFNHATVAFYWDSMEPEQGRFRCAPDSPHLARRPPTDFAVDWCMDHGIRPKGHWLFCDNFVPEWVPKNGRDLRILLEKRIEFLAGRYGGKVTIWDAVNEAFSNHRRFSENIGWSVTPRDYVYEVFKLAEKYFPSYTELCYNDGHWISFAHFCHENSPVRLLAENLLSRGARLGGLGLQFHMFGRAVDFSSEGGAHPYFDPMHQFHVLDEYASLGIPLHMTETSLPAYPEFSREAGEEVQAKLLRPFYRLWFSHPAMKSIIWWNFADKTAWGDESQYNAGLVSRDMEEKPAYRELDRLVNHEWHTETAVETDERGIADWNGFYGDYDVEISSGRTVLKNTIKLASDGENEIRMKLS